MLFVSLTILAIRLNAQTDIVSTEKFEIMVDGNWQLAEEGTPPISKTSILDEVVTANVRYPNKALRMGIEGDVLLEVVIDAEGYIANTLVTKSVGAGTQEMIEEMATKLPFYWSPAMVGGKAVPSKITIIFSFYFSGAPWLNKSVPYYRHYYTPGRAKTVNLESLKKDKKKKS